MSRGTPTAWADLVADALTGDLLLPYIPPPRPLSMSGPDTLWIRDGYVARTHTSASPDAPAITTLGTAPPSVRHVMQTLAARLTHDRVWDVSGLSPADIRAGAAQEAGATVACAYRLEQEPDVHALLAALGDARAHAPLVLVAARVRACAKEHDDAGPPADARFLRQWTFFEMHALLNHAGLAPAFGGIVPDGGDRVVTSEHDAVFVILGTPTIDRGGA